MPSLGRACSGTRTRKPRTAPRAARGGDPALARRDWVQPCELSDVASIPPQWRPWRSTRPCPPSTTRHLSGRPSTRGVGRRRRRLRTSHEQTGVAPVRQGRSMQTRSRGGHRCRCGRRAPWISRGQVRSADGVGARGRASLPALSPTFRIAPVDSEHCRVAARSSAEFPGLHGMVYRAVVIGSGGHAIGVRNILRSIKTEAEHSRG